MGTRTLVKTIALGCHSDHRMVQTTKNMMQLRAWLKKQMLPRNAKTRRTLVGIGRPTLHKCTVVQMDGTVAKTTVILVFSGKMGNQWHRVTMGRECATSRALSHHIRSPSMSIFKNTIILLSSKMTEQLTKLGLSSIIPQTIRKKPANLLRFLIHGATRHNRMSRIVTSVA